MAAAVTKPAVTVKLRAEAYAAMEKILAQVARSGWMSIGRDSDETATKEAVVAHAVIELARKAKK